MHRSNGEDHDLLMLLTYWSALVSFACSLNSSLREDGFKQMLNQPVDCVLIISKGKRNCENCRTYVDFQRAPSMLNLRCTLKSENSGEQKIHLSMVKTLNTDAVMNCSSLQHWSRSTSGYLTICHTYGWHLFKSHFYFDFYRFATHLNAKLTIC